MSADSAPPRAVDSEIRRLLFLQVCPLYRNWVNDRIIIEMAIVEIRGIQKVFGDVAAVNGVNLLTRDGEFLVLLGPSGCGKSTRPRMIAGFETPTAGELLIGGTVVNDLPPRARKIAMVFQSYALYPHITVFKNIASR